MKTHCIKYYTNAEEENLKEAEVMNESVIKREFQATITTCKQGTEAEVISTLKFSVGIKKGFNYFTLHLVLFSSSSFAEKYYIRSPNIFR